MKILKDGCYIVVNPYKFTAFEIIFCIIICCMSALSLHIESTDSMMNIIVAVHNYMNENSLEIVWEPPFMYAAII